jgi:hypothetical protein
MGIKILNISCNIDGVHTSNRAQEKMLIHMLHINLSIDGPQTSSINEHKTVFCILNNESPTD